MLQESVNRLIENGSYQGRRVSIVMDYNELIIWRYDSNGRSAGQETYGTTDRKDRSALRDIATVFVALDQGYASKVQPLDLSHVAIFTNGQWIVATWTQAARSMLKTAQELGL